jgi:hypothetical protein
MKTAILSLTCTLLLSASAFASILEEGFGIVYGSDHAFSLKAPKGWMLDNESGVNQRLVVVFYPKGSNWQDSAIIAYAGSRPRTEKIVTADDAAKFAVEDFRAKGSPKYEGKRIKVIKADSGREAVIYHFSGDKFGNSEAIAYFPEEKTINFLVMNSRDPKLFADSLEAFEALAKSYTFMGDHPVVEKKDEPKKPQKKKPGK